MGTELPVGIKPAHVHARGKLPAGAGALAVLTALIAAALAGLLGGSASPEKAIASPSALLRLEQPTVIRSGMFFETRIELTARKPLRDATIAMTSSLWKSITINTVMPQASEEEFSQGNFRMHFGRLEEGETIRLKLDSQVNPDLFGGTSGSISAYDDNRMLATLPVAIRVLP